MKLRYLLPFLFFFSAQAQFKTEVNKRELDFKSEYVDVSARDTFGLKNLVNIKGIIRVKYDNSSLHAARNGLLNHHYGGNFDLGWLNFYGNQSNQNTKTENSNSQDSPIGKIVTQTTILNEDKIREFGLTLRHDDFFISSEHSVNRNIVKGSTSININGEQDLIPFSFDFRNESNVHTIGFEHAFLKYIQNKQDGNEFVNYLAGANYHGLSLYYGKDIAAFFNYPLFKSIDANLSYDKKLKINLATCDYSRINKADFERNLENRLRIVPRAYDSKLEMGRTYLHDMFFTDLYSFSLDKDKITASLNLGNILFHYSKENPRMGLKYKFAIATYDFKQKEARVGIFLD